MEFAIPISRFDPSKVRWGLIKNGPFRKTISFNYKDNNQTFNSLNLILEPLTVFYVDWDKKQLILEESSQGHFLTKIEQLQTVVNNQIKKQYTEWLDGTVFPKSEEIAPLQPWLKSQKLVLYLSSDPSSIPFFTENGSEVISEKSLKPGDLIRAVVCLQGISLQLSESNNWLGKSRIQHYLIKLYHITK